MVWGRPEAGFLRTLAVMNRIKWIAVVLAIAALSAFFVVRRVTRDAPSGSRDVTIPAVELAQVERGPIESRRTFSGSLQARSRFVVAATVGGRVERLLVDLGDAVTQGQVIA